MRAAIFTLDTGAYKAKAESAAATALKRILEHVGFEVRAASVLPQERAVLASVLKQLADSLISRNEYLSVAYSARARAEFSEGDIGSFIEDKLKAIELAPYQYDEYTDYLEILSYCEGLYLENGNTEDAKICAERAAEIPDMLEQLQE